MPAPDLKPYPLPPEVEHSILELADRSDVLIFGEFHGTQEMPRLLLGLLGPLARRGYRGLAFEMPADQREELVRWARGEQKESPPFFTRPYPDGRGNEQTLALVRLALSKGWQILCFDLGQDQPFRSWVRRDADMARNFTAQRDRLCPGRKVLGVCGNMHSRVERMPGEAAQFWPSFADNVRRLNHGAVVSSVVVWTHAGTFFNGGERSFMDRGPLAAPEIREGKPSQHSLALHLPQGTAATFLVPPQP